MTIPSAPVMVLSPQQQQQQQKSTVLRERTSSPAPAPLPTASEQQQQHQQHLPPRPPTMRSLLQQRPSSPAVGVLCDSNRQQQKTKTNRRAARGSLPPAPYLKLAAAVGAGVVIQLVVAHLLLTRGCPPPPV